MLRIYPSGQNQRHQKVDNLTLNKKLTYVAFLIDWFANDIDDASKGSSTNGDLSNQTLSTKESIHVT